MLSRGSFPMWEGGGGSFGMIFVVGLGVFVTLVSPYPILLATGDVVDLGI